MDADGKPLQVGSKVRVQERKSTLLGIELAPFTATIVKIDEDKQGPLLRVRQKRVDHDRAVRPDTVVRRRFKAVA
ncbi:MAG: hypothetical protein WBG86_17935 [Polyangiales bacterium]